VVVVVGSVVVVVITGVSVIVELEVAVSDVVQSAARLRLRYRC